MRVADLISDYDPDEFNAKFRYKKHLGAGSYGNVDLYTELATGVDRAVKFIKKTDLKPETIEAVRKEANIMRNLDHPNVVRLLAVSEDETQLILILEFCDGGELLSFIKDNLATLDEHRAMNLMKQVFSALAYLHKRGIVHRD